MNLANVASQTFSTFSQPEKWQDLAKRATSSPIPTILAIALVVLIGARLAELTWSLISPESNTPSTVASQTSSSEPAVDPAENIQKLANLHLFGDASSAPVAPQTRVAPPTQLNLTLHGIFVEDDPKLGAAIIGKTNAEQRFYQVGDAISGGAKLEEVREDHVILSRNGKFETLRFPKTQQIPLSSKPIGSEAATLTGGNASGISPTPGNLAQYREMIQKEPLKLLDYVRVLPVRSGNTLKGYRLLPQRDRSLYNQLGIKPSDIVTAVNGIPLTNEREAAKIMGELSKATQLVVDVNRNGQPMSLNLNLQ